jgi:hypothetical protein
MLTKELHDLCLSPYIREIRSRSMRLQKRSFFTLRTDEKYVEMYDQEA